MIPCDTCATSDAFDISDTCDTSNTSDTCVIPVIISEVHNDVMMMLKDKIHIEPLDKMETLGGNNLSNWEQRCTRLSGDVER